MEMEEHRTTLKDHQQLGWRGGFVVFVVFVSTLTATTSKVQGSAAPLIVENTGTIPPELWQSKNGSIFFQVVPGVDVFESQTLRTSFYIANMSSINATEMTCTLKAGAKNSAWLSSYISYGIFLEKFPITTTIELEFHSIVTFSNGASMAAFSQETNFSYPFFAKGLWELQSIACADSALNNIVLDQTKGLFTCPHNGVEYTKLQKTQGVPTSASIGCFKQDTQRSDIASPGPLTISMSPTMLDKGTTELVKIKAVVVDDSSPISSCSVSISFDDNAIEGPLVYASTTLYPLASQPQKDAVLSTSLPVVDDVVKLATVNVLEGEIFVKAYWPVGSYSISFLRCEDVYGFQSKSFTTKVIRQLNTLSGFAAVASFNKTSQGDAIPPSILSVSIPSDFEQINTYSQAVDIPISIHATDDIAVNQCSISFRSSFSFSSPFVSTSISVNSNDPNPANVVLEGYLHVPRYSSPGNFTISSLYCVDKVGRKVDASTDSYISFAQQGMGDTESPVITSFHASTYSVTSISPNVEFVWNVMDNEVVESCSVVLKSLNTSQIITVTSTTQGQNGNFSGSYNFANKINTIWAFKSVECVDAAGNRHTVPSTNNINSVSQIYSTPIGITQTQSLDIRPISINSITLFSTSTSVNRRIEFEILVTSTAPIQYCTLTVEDEFLQTTSATTTLRPPLINGISIYNATGSIFIGFDTPLGVVRITKVQCINTASIESTVSGADARQLSFPSSNILHDITAVAAVGDVFHPRILFTNVSYDEDSLHVSVNISVTDDLSGVEACTVWIRSSLLDSSIISIATDPIKEAQSITNGFVFASTTIEAEYPHGVWSVVKVQCSDFSNRVTTIGDTSLTSYSSEPSSMFEKSTIGDVSSPRIHTITLSKNIVDTRDTYDEVNLVISVSDDLIGTSFCAFLYEADGRAAKKALFRPATDGISPNENVEGVITLHFPPGNPSLRWNLTQVLCSDGTIPNIRPTPLSTILSREEILQSYGTKLDIEEVGVADYDIPQFHNISFIPSTTKVSGSIPTINTRNHSEVVEVVAYVTDDFSGPSFLLLLLRTPGLEKGRIDVVVGCPRVDDYKPNAPVRCSSIFTVPRWSASTNFFLDEIRIQDFVGNNHILTVGNTQDRENLPTLGTSVLFQEDAGDVFGPVLSNLQVSLATIDTSFSSQLVTISFHAEDDNSGIATCSVTITSPYGVDDTKHLFFEAEGRVKETLLFNFFFPQSSPQGQFEITDITCHDHSSKISIHDVVTLAFLSKAPIYINQNGITDVTPPSILNVYVGNAPEQFSVPLDVTVNIDITDDLSGVSRCQVYAGSSNQLGFSPSPLKDVLLAVVFHLYPSDLKSFSISFISCYDEAGNSAFWTPPWSGDLTQYKLQLPLSYDLVPPVFHSISSPLADENSVIQIEELPSAPIQLVLDINVTDAGSSVAFCDVEISQGFSNVLSFRLSRQDEASLAKSHAFLFPQFLPTGLASVSQIICHDAYGNSKREFFFYNSPLSLNITELVPTTTPSIRSLVVSSPSQGQWSENALPTMFRGNATFSSPTKVIYCHAELLNQPEFISIPLSGSLSFHGEDVITYEVTSNLNMPFPGYYSPQITCLDEARRVFTSSIYASSLAITGHGKYQGSGTLRVVETSMVSMILLPSHTETHIFAGASSMHITLKVVADSSEPIVDILQVCRVDYFSSGTTVYSITSDFEVKSKLAAPKSSIEIMSTFTVHGIDSPQDWIISNLRCWDGNVGAHSVSLLFPDYSLVAFTTTPQRTADDVSGCSITNSNTFSMGSDGFEVQAGAKDDVDGVGHASFVVEFRNIVGNGLVRRNTFFHYFENHDTSTTTTIKSTSSIYLPWNLESSPPQPPQVHVFNPQTTCADVGGGQGIWFNEIDSGSIVAVPTSSIYSPLLESDYDDAFIQEMAKLHSGLLGWGHGQSGTLAQKTFLNKNPTKKLFVDTFTSMFKTSSYADQLYQAKCITDAKVTTLLNAISPADISVEVVTKDVTGPHVIDLWWTPSILRHEHSDIPITVALSLIVTDLSNISHCVVELDGGRVVTFSTVRSTMNATIDFIQGTHTAKLTKLIEFQADELNQAKVANYFCVDNLGFAGGNEDTEDSVEGASIHIQSFFPPTVIRLQRGTLGLTAGGAGYEISAQIEFTSTHQGKHTLQVRLCSPENAYADVSDSVDAWKTRVIYQEPFTLQGEVFVSPQSKTDKFSVLLSERIPMWVQGGVYYVCHVACTTSGGVSELTDASSLQGFFATSGGGPSGEPSIVLEDFNSSQDFFPPMLAGMKTVRVDLFSYSVVNSMLQHSTLFASANSPTQFSLNVSDDMSGVVEAYFLLQGTDCVECAKCGDYSNITVPCTQVPTGTVDPITSGNFVCEAMFPEAANNSNFGAIVVSDAFGRFSVHAPLNVFLPNIVSGSENEVLVLVGVPSPTTTVPLTSTTPPLTSAVTTAASSTTPGGSTSAPVGDMNGNAGSFPIIAVIGAVGGLIVIALVVFVIVVWRRKKRNRIRERESFKRSFFATDELSEMGHTSYLIDSGNEGLATLRRKQAGIGFVEETRLDSSGNNSVNNEERRDYLEPRPLKVVSNAQSPRAFSENPTYQDANRGEGTTYESLYTETSQDPEKRTYLEPTPATDDDHYYSKANLKNDMEQGSDDYMRPVAQTGDQTYASPEKHTYLEPSVKANQESPMYDMVRDNAVVKASLGEEGYSMLTSDHIHYDTSANMLNLMPQKQPHENDYANQPKSNIYEGEDNGDKDDDAYSELGDGHLQYANKDEIEQARLEELKNQGYLHIKGSDTNV
eukprot:m.79291 g.79291  ORF g.79291 m.79291 type:complete len:2791 (-) comp8600_c0_seq2:479-8851(-)